MQIESLFRYPVKGLTPEKLAAASLATGRCIQWDRAFALAQGDAAFDPQNPAWLAKTNFMCLLRNAGIARLRTRFDEASGLLTILTPAGQTIKAAALEPEGQAALTEFFTRFLGAEARFGPHAGAPRFHYAPDHSFCDHRTQVISLIGHGSLGALEAAVGAARDKRRFRANIYVSEIEPWVEFSWLGKVLAIGEARLQVRERIDRCGATTVNPDTAKRDANPVKELQQNFGHVDLGVFAEVVRPGVVRPGDAITLM